MSISETLVEKLEKDIKVCEELKKYVDEKTKEMKEGYVEYIKMLKEL